MMTHRSHRRGTLMLDRRFGKILGPGERSHLQRASGTNNPKLVAQMGVMLDQFAERQPDLLRELIAKHLHPLQAYHLWISGAWLKYTGRAEHARPLIDTVTSWAKRKQKKLSQSTRIARLLWADVVTARAKTGDTLAELPSLMDRWRTVCEDDDKASTFNHHRNYARAFLRDTLKKSDPLYLAIADLSPLKETPKRGRHPQTPEGARVIAQRLGEKAGPIWLSLCYCGMTMKEFFEDGWEVDYPLGAVRIHGQKREKRERYVPLLAMPVVPLLTRGGFKSALQRLKAGVTAHDARRSYANWLVAANVTENHRPYYRGHEPVGMGQLYEQPGQAMTMIREWIVEDTPKLQTYCGLPKAGLNVESA
jgi:hypothetical protein